MIRRDFILRMIEEFFQVLSRLKGLKQGELWQEAAATIDQEFKRLLGAGSAAVTQLSDTELLAKILQGESPLVVRQKTLMLTALLKEAGDVAARQDHPEESCACYLKGLHLLLNVLSRGELADCPEFVPKTEVFLAALQDSELPLSTHAMLMQHFERTGEFAKAEDALFHMLEAQPQEQALLQFGITFYERLKTCSDADLRAGNLPREELEASLAELRAARPMSGV